VILGLKKSVDGKKWEKRVWKTVYYCEELGSKLFFSTTVMEKTRDYGFYHGNRTMH